MEGQDQDRNPCLLLLVQTQQVIHVELTRVPPLFLYSASPALDEFSDLSGSLLIELYPGGELHAWHLKACSLSPKVDGRRRIRLLDRARICCSEKEKP